MNGPKERRVLSGKVLYKCTERSDIDGQYNIHKTGSDQNLLRTI